MRRKVFFFPFAFPSFVKFVIILAIDFRFFLRSLSCELVVKWRWWSESSFELSGNYAFRREKGCVGEEEEEN